MVTPFDENPIGSHRRNRYGEYRERYSKGRVPKSTGGTYVRLNGWTFVKMTITSVPPIAKPTVADVRINAVRLVTSKVWNGTPVLYMMINGIVVYPWTTATGIAFATWVDLYWEWVRVRTGEELEVWVASTDATDGIINDANAAVLLRGIIDVPDYTDYFS